jgi:ADP-heptose:LPS heptosyltransferase
VTHGHMEAPRQVLVIALGGAGDGLMATPLLSALRAHWPQAAVDVLVMQGAVARDMVAGHPAVRECILHPFMREPWWRSLAVCRKLRRRRYDLSLTVMPQNRLEYNAVTFLIGARRRLGFAFCLPCGAMGRWLLTDLVPEDPLSHLVENNLRLLSEGLGVPAPSAPLQLPVSASHRRAAQALLRDLGLAGRRVIGLHAGSGTTKNLAQRRWPTERWAALARGLAATGDDAFLMVGSTDEQPLRDAIRGHAGLPADRLLDLPPMPILDAAAVIGELDVLVCCDTLLTHVAAAMGTPCVVIMGPTPHASVYPWQAPHRIVRLGMTCSPCYGYSRHGIRCTHPEPMACLTRIEPAQVAAAVTSLLAETGNRG